MAILGWIILGFIAGFIVAYGITYKGDIIGTIQIDTSSKDADIYRLVWEEDPEKLKNEKYTVFRIDTRAKLREESNDYSE